MQMESMLVAFDPVRNIVYMNIETAKVSIQDYSRYLLDDANGTTSDALLP